MILLGSSLMRLNLHKKRFLEAPTSIRPSGYPVRHLMLNLISLQETEQIGQARHSRAAAGGDGVLGAIELDQADVAHLWHEHKVWRIERRAQAHDLRRGDIHHPANHDPRGP